uniref:Pyridine nucleotide-disulphide oxidoreductase n=1 Tax=Candidatus Kentrum sp. TC TaxID=2126339 RepID=A0A451A7H4_9GAMM|nr:MAG: Pyridine nucleotide-disulphide oxidoreductase [Candidatus Kentron sp. TC]VFK48305.1 MAG: Pyridine nucleotide-disulphide oxidoreductase [Candidatus Kentron sp. TC]VFK61977.1 MAG: Pyridine nucleotide-disulphide oxidoreductase [Candidatus Kentron sp. TC]
MNGQTETLWVDKLVVACGRQSIRSGLELEKIGLKTNSHGEIEVDTHCHTGIGGAIPSRMWFENRCLWLIRPRKKE